MRGKVQWIGAVALVLIAGGAGIVVPAPAYAEVGPGPGIPVPKPAPPQPVPDEHHFVINIEQDSAVIAQFCVRSDTMVKSDPHGLLCTGDMTVRNTESFTIPYTSGDKIMLSVNVASVGTRTIDDISGGGGCSANYEPRCVQCITTGSAFSTKLNCNLANAVQPAPSMSPLPPYVDTSGGVLDLLNLLAWCVSACAVLGLILVGTNMAIQLRRGDPGEMSEYWRGFATVIGACVLGLSAGPLVQLLIPFI